MVEIGKVDKSKKIMSWDFDDTLYDWENDVLIDKTYALFKKQQASGYEMVITTFRCPQEVDDIKKHLPGIPIWCTCRISKVGYLRKKLNEGYKICTHYDDDRITYYELKQFLPEIKAVLIKNYPDV